MPSGSHRPPNPVHVRDAGLRKISGRDHGSSSPDRSPPRVRSRRMAAWAQPGRSKTPATAARPRSAATGSASRRFRHTTAATRRVEPSDDGGDDNLAPPATVPATVPRTVQTPATQYVPPSYQYSPPPVVSPRPETRWPKPLTFPALGTTVTLLVTDDAARDDAHEILVVRSTRSTPRAAAFATTPSSRTSTPTPGGGATSVSPLFLRGARRRVARRPHHRRDRRPDRRHFDARARLRPDVRHARPHRPPAPGDRAARAGLAGRRGGPGPLDRAPSRRSGARLRRHRQGPVRRPRRGRDRRRDRRRRAREPRR